MDLVLVLLFKEIASRFVIVIYSTIRFDCIFFMQKAESLKQPLFLLQYVRVGMYQV